MKKRERTTTAFIGAIFTIIGLFFLSYNYVQAKRMVAHDYMASLFYNGEEVIEKVEEKPKAEVKEEPKVEQVKKEEPVSNEYIGYLNIPKINLVKGFMDQRSSKNDVEQNILVVAGSDYPDVKKGNFILAGHSGTGWKAFFNDLYKLEMKDTAFIEYKGKKYIYTITNIYTQPKIGKVSIYRNYDKTTLTLITCTNNDSTTQTIYILELTSIEE